jgi:monoterpene epsilon-lactone hydrolase
MDAIREMYARWAAGDMGVDDQWGDVTAEPRGVDYVEVSADGVPAMWLRPQGADPDRVIVALHGGGFVGGSLFTHRKMYAHLAKRAGVPVLLATYRMAPEHKYPAQIEDAVTAYRWAAGRSARAAVAGDSSGGGLAVQVALRVPGVAAVLALSPWLDMDPAQTSGTYESSAGVDLVFTRPMVQGLIDGYLPAGVSGLDPAVNALHAELSGLPPVFVQCGAEESGRGDSERFAALAEKAGVETRLDVFDGQLHTFQMVAGRSAVADDAIGRFAAWVRPKLSR